jgi:hypothetical protein
VAEDLFHESLGRDESPVCPRSRSVRAWTQRNLATHPCRLVAPQDIACGSRSLDPHECPHGWVCEEPGNDAPGDCLERCGKIAGLGCPQGYRREDDPNDGCDPRRGADCLRLCRK